MNETSVIVQLTDGQDVYWPGDRLTGRYRVVGVDPSEIQGVELSIHWFTEGKGDSDVGVHHYQMLGDDNSGPALEGEFATVLPPSPWSYDGLLVKIIWCVQVRATLRRSKKIEGIAYFCLGDVAPAVEAVK
jgi:hypothetical protein